METLALLVGQAPGPNTDPDLPLFPVPSTSAGGRLVKVMGIARADYFKCFDRVNLLPYFPGRTRVRDDSFPMAPAKLAARVMRPLLANRTVILVGRNVADAFELDIPFHEWRDVPMRRREPLKRQTGLSQLAVIPHPSGRNHWYNHEANRLESRAFWDRFFS